MRMPTLALTLACGLSLACPIYGQEAAAAALPASDVQQARRPLVQLAILLDTSGSMNGLIDQAKIQLWSIVNEFATARREGSRPELQVALYEYGKSTIPASEGYLRMILPLTTDLDAVSEQLFALQTNGGEEYCGRVIKAAAEGLAWSDVPSDVRIMVIAGNEPFTQGDVDFREAIPAAVRMGIVINTIHCGDEQTGIATGWKDGAILGEGAYSVIDQNRAVAHIAAPQDEEIARLGVELNTTYIAFGEAGVQGYARQRMQDANAQGAAPAAEVQRAVSKASTLYQNASWDLVDAVNQKQVKLEEIKPEDLPEAMRAMTPEQRAQHVGAMAQRRQALQVRIQALDAERQSFVTARRRELGEDNTLGAALLAPMKKQAEAKGFVFENN
jgi:hypothetical protein